MTKHQFLARLVRAPIQVEAISKLMWYRVAPHGERDPNAGVYLCLAPIGGELVVLDGLSAGMQPERTAMDNCGPADDSVGTVRLALDIGLGRIEVTR